MRVVRRWFEMAVDRTLLLLADRRGATTAEYALLLTLVAVALIGVLTDLRNVLIQKIQQIINSLGGAG